MKGKTKWENIFPPIYSHLNKLVFCSHRLKNHRSLFFSIKQILYFFFSFDIRSKDDDPLIFTLLLCSGDWTQFSIGIWWDFYQIWYTNFWLNFLFHTLVFGFGGNLWNRLDPQILIFWLSTYKLSFEWWVFLYMEKGFSLMAFWRVFYLWKIAVSVFCLSMKIVRILHTF
jgi:hypothetical protein